MGKQANQVEQLNARMATERSSGRGDLPSRTGLRTILIIDFD